MVENSFFEETNASLEEWSDEKCFKIASQDNFPCKVKNIYIQKSIISRFFKFYLSGKIQKGLSVTDVIFSTISIMPMSWYSDNVLWDDTSYSEEGTLFFISPEDKLNAEVKNIIKNRNKPIDIQLDLSKNVQSGGVINGSQSDMSTPIKEIMWFSLKSVYKHKSKVISTNAKPIEPAENAAFCASVNNLFNKWDSEESARAYLKYYFGLSALILMRTLILPYQKVMSAFTQDYFREVQKEIFSHYSIPDKKCVQKSFKTFRKMDSKIQTMLAKLVIQSILLNKSEHECYIKNVLKFGLLTHTANFRMDLIKMLQEVAVHTHCFYKLWEMLNVEELSNTWKRIHYFLKKYMSENNMKTIYWARVIESDQFEYLSCSNNFEFAVVVAVFIEKFSNHSGIWNAKWVKNGNNLQIYQDLGLKIYKKYMKYTNTIGRFGLNKVFNKLTLKM